MKESTLYTLKVWQTATLLSPVFIVQSQLYSPSSFADTVFIVVLFSLFGMIFSLPSAVLLLLSVLQMSALQLKPNHGKLILSVVALAGVLVAFAMLSIFLGGMDKEYYIIAALYAAIVITGVWFYRLPNYFGAMEAA